jgi:hypothetical protein
MAWDLGKLAFFDCGPLKFEVCLGSKKWKFAESHNKDKELGVILLAFYNDVAQRVLLQCCHILFFPLVTLLLKHYPFSYLFLVLLLLFLAKNYIFSFL